MKPYFRVVAEVSLDAIEHNYNEFRKAMKNDVKLCAVIKADAYGHGALPIGLKLQELGADCFAVATLDEAMELRMNGLNKPIIIFGFTPKQNMKAVIEHHLIQTIFNLEMAKDLSSVARELKIQAHVHINIDTGMNRIGFSPNNDSIAKIKEIHSLTNIQIDGIFSHFARADEVDKSTSNQQKKRYEDFLNQLEELGIDSNLRHMSNSAGLIDVSDAKYDMVRVGIAMYGLYPSDEVDKEQIRLQPTLTLKSHVVQVKNIDAGQPISYGGTYVTNKESKIATIPIGYGDGYPRLLSNKGEVLIAGVKAPIRGRVCMDLFMVDVTHIPNVKEGDEVVLIGSQGKETIAVEDIARIMGTINYEVVCQLGKRIPRSYV